MKWIENRYRKTRRKRPDFYRLKNAVSVLFVSRIECLCIDFPFGMAWMPVTCWYVSLFYDYWQISDCYNPLCCQKVKAYSFAFQSKTEWGLFGIGSQMKGHGCSLSGWQAPEFSCKCLIFRCESIYYPHDHLFLIRSVKNEYKWIAGKWRDSGW